MIEEPEITNLTKAVFDFLNNHAYQYCVERNYEEYPEKVTGDIDIIVCDGDIHDIANGIISVAAGLGWRCYQSRTWDVNSYIGLSKDIHPARFTLTIELFSGAKWKGIDFLSAEEILQNRLPVKKIYKPHPAHEAIITSIHHLLYNKEIPEKYWLRTRKNVLSEKVVFIETLSRYLGSSLANQICSLILSESWGELSNLSSKIRGTLLIHSLISNPVKLAQMIGKGYLETKRRPKGIVILITPHDSTAYNHRDIANSLLETAIRWHIFIPPHRKIFPNDSNLREVHNIYDRGGISIIHNCTRSLVSLRNTYEIDLKEGKIRLPNGNYSVNPEELPFCDQESALAETIWNSILGHHAHH